MKIKLLEIIGAQEAINKIDRTKFDIRISYRLNKILNKLTSEIKDFDKTRNELVMKYAKETEIEDAQTKQKRKSLAVPPESLETVTKEIETLLNQEIELDIWQIPMSLLIDKLELSPVEVRMLDKFLIYDIEEQKDKKENPVKTEENKPTSN